MKSIFDEGASEEIIRRISMLNENSSAKWGKMTVYQMLKHCTLWEEMLSGEKKSKRMLVGRLIGKMVLKQILKDEKPMIRNGRTVPGFNVTGQGDFETEKRKWIAMVAKHSVFSNEGIIHPFFGKMTKEQIGYLAYKHTDHHLRQFHC